MSEQIEYIEAYFQKKLSDAERREFEERCIQDKEFADEVAFYISSMEVTREKLLEQKKREWSVYNDKQSSTSAATPVVRMTARRFLPYAVAASLVIVVLVYSLYSPGTPGKLANDYITQNYTELSHTMSASSDSLESGISAYNDKDYNKAIAYFQKIYDTHPENTEVKKYLGLSFLMQKDYDKALVHFDELAAKKSVFSNPGLFLKAVTLMRRNQAGDEENARRLLQEVDSQQLEGSAQARKWLEEWPKK